MDIIDNDILTTFKNVTTKRELAELLGSSLKNLAYNLHIRPEEERYTIYSIPKKRGGFREICAPISRIKHIQKELTNILNDFSTQKNCVHGYVKNKSIKTNALVHSKQRIVINLDLKDFFNSINFGRVRGLFKAYPFNFNDEIATTLAQICCYDNKLPQGAPSSPILSNYICRKLDNQLSILAREHKMNYSRYADDITLSTNLIKLPLAIGKIRNNNLFLSKRFKDIIQANKFTINTKKTHFALTSNRQEVTGLIVNSRLNVPRKYVRHIRAMLHAWKTYGLEAAAKEHFEKYNYKNKKTSYPSLSFINELVGKIGYIGYIKGHNDPIYKELYTRIKSLDNTVKLSIPEDIDVDTNTTIVFCEGKTDGIHLTAALKFFQQKGEFVDLNVFFYKYRDEHKINNSELFKICETRPTLKQSSRLEIFLFDRDVPKYKNDTCVGGKNYKNWTNNVFSAVLPIPPHRTFDEICIEHYYYDETIVIEDKNGRRLYLSSEFDADSGMHKDKNLLYRDRSSLKAHYPRILDSGVFKENGTNIALSKNDFAKNISESKDNFKDISFENFRIIFQLLSEIISLSKKK